MPVLFKAGLGMKVRPSPSRDRFPRAEVRTNMTPSISTGEAGPADRHPFIYSVYLSKLLGRFITSARPRHLGPHEGPLTSGFLELTTPTTPSGRACSRTPGQDAPGKWWPSSSRRRQRPAMFFRYLDKTHPALRAASARMSAAVIEELYKKMDDLVGRVAAGLDGRSALFVMSDHGFKPSGAASTSTPGSTETATSASSRGVGKRRMVQGRRLDEDEGLRLGLGASTSTSKAAKPRGRSAGSGGRRSESRSGTQAHGPQGRSERTRRDHPRLRRDAIYAGPYKDNAPTSSSATTRATGLLDGVTGVINATVIGDNTSPGAATMHRPGPRPGRALLEPEAQYGQTSIMDIAPTALALFGVAPPGHMDGRVLIETAKSRTSKDRGIMSGRKTPAA